MPKVGSSIIFKRQHSSELLKGVITSKRKEIMRDSFGKKVKRMVYEVEVKDVNEADGYGFIDTYDVARNSLNSGYIEIGFDRYFGGYVGYDI